MSYEILSPTHHAIIGWFQLKKGRHSFTIREADDYDKNEFDCEFRVCSLYRKEYVQNEEGEVQHNPIYWSRPARRYANGIEVLSEVADEKWAWRKWYGELSTGEAGKYGQDYYDFSRNNPQYAN